MKKNPGRKARRNAFFQAKRKQGDLNRRSTHVMRSKMGMHRAPELTPRPESNLSWWRRILKWIRERRQRWNNTMDTQTSTA